MLHNRSFVLLWEYWLEHQNVLSQAKCAYVCILPVNYLQVAVSLLGIQRGQSLAARMGQLDHSGEFSQIYIPQKINKQNKIKMAKPLNPPKMLGLYLKIFVM